ncbi:MAG TPA: histidine kinase dimerization/phosphoacceptor domain -containing protein, partial [Bacillota bacterium]|nr:histidine kinase dimerization/phosphoacceptor domain -containing protein [Bacillota bacterium]
LAVISLLTLQILGSQLEKRITAKNMWLAQSLAGEIEELLNAHQSILGVVSGFLVKENGIDERQINRYLETITDSYQYFDTIQVLDNEGVVRYLAPYKQDYDRLNLSGQDFFKQTRARKQTYWSSSFISIQTGQPVVAVTRPYKNGVIVGYLNISKIRDVIERVYTGQTGWVEIVDQNGTYIVHTVNSLVNQRVNVKNRYSVRQGLTGNPGSYIDQLRGQDVLTSVAVVAQTGWPVLICQYAADAFAPVRITRNIFLAVALCGLLMAYLMAAHSLKKISQPFVELAKRAAKVASGQYDITVNASEFQEYEELINDFNLMTRAIQSREKALRESEERYELALEGANDGLWDWDLKNGVFYLSPRGKAVLGLSATADFRKWKEFLLPDDVKRFMGDLRAYLSGKVPQFRNEYRFLHRDGSYRWLLIRGKALRNDQNKVYRMAGSATDVTERRRVDEQVQASLREKEVLLKEIHHRVKNNMQVISSLLRLQSAFLNDQHVVELFEESQNRIKTMALVHEKLYQSNDLAKINIKDYVMHLTNSLFRSYGISVERVRLELEIEEIRLGIDAAIPCGLIINELMSNVLKYAFPGERTGSVKVSIKHSGPRKIELIVADDGVGIPPEVDVENTDSLGLQLIRTLGQEQLQGQVFLKRDSGTEFRIVFQEG